MRVLRPLLLILAVVSTIASVSAQQSASTVAAASDPQAVALLQQSLTALSAGSPISDVSMTGTVTVTTGPNSQSGTITMFATAAGQCQITLVLPSGTWTTVQDYAANPRTSTRTGPDGTTEDTTAEDLSGPSPAWFFPAMLVNVASPAKYVISDRGQKKHDGYELHDVAIWPRLANDVPAFSLHPPAQQVLTGPKRASSRHTGQEDLYLAPSTVLPESLVWRIWGYREKNGSPDFSEPILGIEEVRFFDYRQVEGHMVAFHLQVSIAAASRMDIQLSTVAFHTAATAAAN